MTGGDAVQWPCNITALLWDIDDSITVATVCSMELSGHKPDQT